MPQADVIQNTKMLITKEKIIKDIQQLGVKPGDTLMVHSSLKSIGWVCGNEQTVVDAILETVTTNGTVIMSTQTTGNSEPSNWQAPPVPKEWWEEIRTHMPAFSPERTPSVGMGKIAECFRTYPDVKRSNHPMYSVAAWGKHADEIVSNHTIHVGLGDGSPLKKLYNRKGKILLLGVAYDSCTALHLAEHRSGVRGQVEQSCAMFVNGKREWVTYSEMEMDEECFLRIGADYEKEHPFTKGYIGQAQSRLIPVASLVVFGTEWLTG